MPVIFRRKIVCELEILMTNTNLPNDPVMLLSFVNTQLRDFYSSLDDFCGAFHIEAASLCEKLSAIDYEYDAATNQFR